MKKGNNNNNNKKTTLLFRMTAVPLNSFIWTASDFHFAMLYSGLWCTSDFLQAISNRLKTKEKKARKYRSTRPSFIPASESDNEVLVMLVFDYANERYLLCANIIK